MGSKIFATSTNPSPGVLQCPQCRRASLWHPSSPYLDDDAIASPLSLGYQNSAIRSSPMDLGSSRPHWLTSGAGVPAPSLITAARSVNPHESLATRTYFNMRQAGFLLPQLRTGLRPRGAALSLLSNEETQVSESIHARGGKIVSTRRVCASNLHLTDRTSATLAQAPRCVASSVRASSRGRRKSLGGVQPLIVSTRYCMVRPRHFPLPTCCAAASQRDRF